LRARFCNNCGARLNENRHLSHQNGNGSSRMKLYADIAHPINASSRQEIEKGVMQAYFQELERSKQPGYVPPDLDGADIGLYDKGLNGAGGNSAEPAPSSPMIH
jgi:stage V sporulation protein G